MGRVELAGHVTQQRIASAGRPRFNAPELERPRSTGDRQGNGGGRRLGNPRTCPSPSVGRAGFSYYRYGRVSPAALRPSAAWLASAAMAGSRGARRSHRLGQVSGGDEAINVAQSPAIPGWFSAVSAARPTFPVWRRCSTPCADADGLGYTDTVEGLRFLVRPLDQLRTRTRTCYLPSCARRPPA